MKPNKFHSKYVSLGGRKICEEWNICLIIRLFGFPQRLEMESATTAARKVVSSSTLIGPFKILARAQIQRRSRSLSNWNRFSRLCRTWQKRHWLLRKRERMRDRKLVGSRQRSLSCRFILPRRERPLLAGKYEGCNISIHGYPLITKDTRITYHTSTLIDHIYTNSLRNSSNRYMFSWYFWSFTNCLFPSWHYAFFERA